MIPGTYVDIMQQTLRWYRQNTLCFSVPKCQVVHTHINELIRQYDVLVCQYLTARHAAVHYELRISDDV